MHPVLLQIGSYGLPSYGVFVALGIVLGTVVGIFLSRRAGITMDFVLDAAFWSLLAGFAGARLTYMAVEWRECLRDPVATAFSSGGGVYLGGVVAACAALYALCRSRGVGYLQATDAFVPGLALGHALGRVGCFLTGCCYGSPVQHAPKWLGVSYPRLTDAQGHLEGSWPYLDHLAHGLIDAQSAWSRPVYPVQLFEAFFDLVLFAVLLVLWRRRPPVGRVVVAYLTSYALLRFSLEFLRGDAERGIFAGLSFAQWLCAVVLATVLGAWGRGRLRS